MKDMTSNLNPHLIRADFIAKAKRLVEEAAIPAPPVDPRTLAARRGISKVLVSRSLSVSGQLLRLDDGFVIRLNASEPLERQNFSCCHEIAHTFALDYPFGSLRQRDEALRCLSSSASFEERICDGAAAEMLMPEKFFRPIAAKLEPTMASVFTIASQFGSSIRATILRLTQLDLWSVVFIGWKFTTRAGSSPKLRVKWSARPAQLRCYVPANATADAESGIYACFMASHPTCEIERLDLGSLRGKYLVENARVGEYVISIVHETKLSRRS